MKFIVPSGPLLEKLMAVNGAILAKPVIPAIENFHFDLKGGKLTITTTDLDNYMQETLQVESTDDISVCIPARSTIEILRALGDQPVNFTIDPERFGIEMSTSSGRYKLPGYSPDEFPVTPEIDIVHSFVISSEILGRGISKTLFATGNDDLRPNLTGVFFDIKEDSIQFVATDANRMVRLSHTGVKPGFEHSFIIPKKCLNLLKSSLGGGEVPVTVDISSNNIRFSSDTFVLYARIMDERFPDYNAVIPVNNNKTLIVNRQDIIAAVKRISIFANQQTYQIKLKIQGSELHLQSEDIEKSSEAFETLSCEFDGEDMEMGFNSKFLNELITNIESDDILFKLSDPGLAGLILPKQNEDQEDILMLIMPMMLSQY
jgi:DNA polymerase-3 subunit beta